jgi:protection of telomeres protein 1
MWSGYISLLANYRSEIRVCPAKSIPSWPLKSLPATSREISMNSGSLSPAETGYAVWLFNQIKDWGGLPNSKEFEEKTKQAMNVKSKYSLLKDISADRFYDLIGEVIRVYDKNGLVTMYISDYTAHSLFYNNVWGGGDDGSTSHDGDKYGCIKARRRVVNDWPGPYGKLSLHLTVFDDHAKFIREHVKVNDWVLLENVQVKMDNNNGCIEGLLRTDRQAFEGKIQVHIIRRSEDPEMNDIRWKDALRRKLKYWKRFKKQMQELEDSTNSNGKRALTTEGAQKQNSKRRRKERRAATEAKVLASEHLDLNMNGNLSFPTSESRHADMS